MNAHGSIQDAATAAEQRAHEPSMEEILASIRRIIADDQMLPLTRTSAPQPVAPSRSLDEPAQRFEEPVFVEAPAPRAPRMERVVAERQAPAYDAADYAPQPEPVRPVIRPRAPAPEPVAPPRSVEPELRPRALAQAPVAQAPVAPARSDDLLLSPTTGASVSHSFEALANTMFLQNAGIVEEAVREMLRPMLRQWLDNNLPTMVERLVRSEIERVARGGRS